MQGSTSDPNLNHDLNDFEKTYKMDLEKITSFVNLFDDNNIIHKNLEGTSIVPGMYQLALIVEQKDFPDYGYIDAKFSGKLMCEELTKIRKVSDGRYEYELIHATQPTPPTPLTTYPAYPATQSKPTTELKIGCEKTDILDILNFEEKGKGIIKRNVKTIKRESVKLYYNSLGIDNSILKSGLKVPKIIPAMYIPAVLLGYGSGKGYLLGLKLNFFSNPEFGEIEILSMIKHKRGRNCHVELEIIQKDTIVSYGESSILEID